MPRDGVALDPDDGFSMGTAGCGMLVAKGGGMFITAHGGLGSFVDLPAIHNGGNHRAHTGIVHSIAFECCRLNIQTSDVSLVFLFYVDPSDFVHAFDHKEHGKNNRLQYRYLNQTYGTGIMDTTGSIDLGLLVQRQAEQLGFAPVTTAKSLSRDDRYAIGGTSRNIVGLVRKR